MSTNLSFLRSVGLITLLLCLTTTVTVQSAEMIDRVAAVVDDDIIMESELNARSAQIIKSMQTQGSTIPPREELRTQLLNQMIIENLQLQMGNRAGVRITDQQLNNTMASVAGNIGLTLDQFRAKLEAEGQYQQTREQIRQELIIRQVQNGNLSGRIQISDQEVVTFLESKEGQQLSAPRYHLTHLMYPLPIEEEDAAQTSVADKVLSQAAGQINSKFTLEDWLQNHGEVDGVKLEGGDLGWRSVEQMPDIFAELAPTMMVGEVAGPISSPGGLHLVQLVEKSGGAEVVNQSHARHILVKPSEVRSEEQCLDLLNRLRQEISDGADFAALAQKNTEDFGSAQEGGDLGWANPGQFAPAFETALNALQPNELSLPVRTPFGWHLIQLLERREFDISQDMLKERAYSYLHERKFKEELDSWLQKIRDEAYVDIKA